MRYHVKWIARVLLGLALIVTFPIVLLVFQIVVPDYRTVVRIVGVVLMMPWIMMFVVGLYLCLNARGTWGTEGASSTSEPKQDEHE